MKEGGGEGERKVAATNTYKNGLVAVMKALETVCRIIKKYDSKARAALTAAQVAGLITSGDLTLALAFLDTAVATCTVFQKATGYTS
jgi:hypothetical protein